MDKKIYAILFVAFIVILQVCEGTHYSSLSLLRAVKGTCCISYAGKRGVISNRKKRALTFLKPSVSRSRRGLYTECCGSYGCSSYEIHMHSTLTEECVHEGCSIEEIREVCMLFDGFSKNHTVKLQCIQEQEIRVVTNIINDRKTSHAI